MNKTIKNTSIMASSNLSDSEDTIFSVNLGGQSKVSQAK